MKKNAKKTRKALKYGKTTNNSANPLQNHQLRSLRTNPTASPTHHRPSSSATFLRSLSSARYMALGPRGASLLPAKWSQTKQFFLLKTLGSLRKTEEHTTTAVSKGYILCNHHHFCVKFLEHPNTHLTY